MKLSPTLLKWILRTYPPFFFQRIYVQKVHEGFQGMDIKIKKSFLNINSNKTVFGGTIFSALDPIHAILMDSILKNNGLKKSVAWLKSAQINYLKPGRKNLHFSIRITDEEIQEALIEIREKGKFIKTFSTEIFDTDGLLCAICQNEIYIRDLDFDFSKLEQ